VHFRALWGLRRSISCVAISARRGRLRALPVGRRTGSDVDAIMEAHYLSGITACVMGEFAAGQSELEECVRIYGTGSVKRTGALTARTSRHPPWDGLPWRWTCGRPGARAREGLELVRDAPKSFLFARGLALSDSCMSFAEPQGRTLRCRRP
jgi:hypothetical protein